MRGVLLVMLAGCGRFGFGDHPSVDAARDVASDAFVTGLVVEYPMDDDPTAGTMAASVAGYEGTCTRCPAPAAGRIGGAYSFDGAKELRLPANASQVVSNRPYTVTLWFQPVAATSTQPQVMVAKPFSSTSGTNVINLFVNTGSAGEVFFETTATGTTGDYSYISQQTGSVTRGAWHHVGASYDGSTKRLYIDGALIAQSTTSIIDSTQLVTIGADVDSGTVTLNFIGLLDDVRLYDRALTDGEVAALANP